MKKNFKILLLLLLAVAVPFTIASGQEQKNEKKIKIVIDDGSGEKTVLDTTITDGTMPETITTNDGKVIIIDESISHSRQVKGDKMMHVTVTHDTDGENEETEKIIIISGEGDTWTTTTTTGDSKKNVRVYAHSGDAGDIETETGATKYIIAKDGIVVTVESDDEAKAKELIKEIENKLGVKK